MRRVLLRLQAQAPVVLGGLTLADLKKCAPDEENLLRSLPDTLDSASLRRTFGVDPLMLLCWACLFHAVP